VQFKGGSGKGRGDVGGISGTKYLRTNDGSRRLRQAPSYSRPVVHRFDAQARQWYDIRKRAPASLMFGVIVLCTICMTTPATAQQYLGDLSANPYSPNSTSNPYGAGSPHNPNSVTNPFGLYGSPYSPKSATNPYATNAPMLFDNQGNYRGNLSTNPYDPNSVSNPYGRYGSPYSADSINNPYGAGSPYAPNSPTNPYAPNGWTIIGR